MAIPVSKTGSVLVMIGLVGLCLAKEAESGKEMVYLNLFQPFIH